MIQAAIGEMQDSDPPFCRFYPPFCAFNRMIALRDGCRFAGTMQNLAWQRTTQSVQTLAFKDSAKARMALPLQRIL